MDNQPTKTTTVDLSKAFDLDALDTVTASNAGAEFEIMNPATKAKTGIFWTVLGMDSEVFQGIVKDRSDDDNRAAAMAARAGEELPVRTADQISARNVELLTACSTGWRTVVDGVSHPFIVLKGERLEFTVANVSRVLRDFPQIRKQVDSAVGNLSLFIKG